MLVCVVSCSWLWMLLCGIDAVAEGGNDVDRCRLLSMRGWLVGWLVVQARGGMIKGGPIVRTESESRPHPTKAHKQATKQGSKQEGTNPPENDKQGSATNSDSYG